jgi:hypothetical protein
MVNCFSLCACKANELKNIRIPTKENILKREVLFISVKITEELKALLMHKP